MCVLSLYLEAELGSASVPLALHTADAGIVDLTLLPLWGQSYQADRARRLSRQRAASGGGVKREVVDKEALGRN